MSSSGSWSGARRVCRCASRRCCSAQPPQRRAGGRARPPNIPFVKFGGLRFLEAAHVKDALACLRSAENPRDSLAGFRVAQLLPGMGPRLADALERHLAGARFALPPAIANSSRPPPRGRLAGLRRAVRAPVRRRRAVGGAMGLVRRWYEPHVGPAVRRRARPRSRTARAARGGGALARALPVGPDAGSAGRQRRRGRRPTWTRTT